MISKQNFKLETTPIENIFIEEYMPYASDLQNKVYIMGLTLSTQHESSIELIAKKLNITTNDVIESFKYWSSLGLTTLNGKYVIYMSIRQLFLESNYEKRRISNTSLASKKYKTLFTKIDAHLSTNLIESERMKLIKFLNDNDIDDAIVLEAFIAYKKAINRTDRAIKLLISLTEQNIRTLEQYYAHKENWSKRNYHYKEILKAIGKPYSHPNSGEKESIDKWLDTYNYSIEDILSKINEVTKRTSSVNMNYLNAVFTREHEGKSSKKKEHKQKKNDKKTGNYSNLVSNR